MTKNGSLGIFIPTIGSRPEYLSESIRSILDSLPTDRKTKFFVLVERMYAERLSENLGCDCVILESRHLSISEKVTLGVDLLSDMDFVTWLGDDDLLSPESLTEACRFMDETETASFVFGNCTYIDQFGKEIGQNRFGASATSLLPWGPNLVPQPGTVWRQKHYEEIGGIDPKFSMAFDFDLFLRLDRHGGGFYNPKVTSMFRWHRSSSSVAMRWLSVIEASKVRQKNRTYLNNLIAAPFEMIVVFATWVAGKVLSMRLP